MMECSEVREILEIATVEPGGFDRLTAGDTPEAATVAGHLAACPACAEELARLHRADSILRPILATMPSFELRARVLDQVRAVGRDRGTAQAAAPTVVDADPGQPVGAVPAVGEPVAAASVAAAAAGPAGGAAAEAPTGSAAGGLANDPAAGQPTRPGIASGPAPVQAPGRAPTRPRRAWFPAAVAAALVICLVGGALVGRQLAPSTAIPDEGALALAAVARETANLMAAPDAQTVVLRDADGQPRGSLVAAQSLGRMVVTATDLPEPGPGREYRCWVEANGKRTPLGEMWSARDAYWWSGPAALPDAAPGTMKFGVSLAPAQAPSGGTGPAATPVPVLLGS